MSGNLPCFIPVHTFFIQKDSHQLGNCHGRMSIVQLEGYFLRQIMQIAVRFFELFNSSLNTCGNKEVLLFQTQLFTCIVVVVRIQNFNDVLSQVFLLYCFMIFTLVKQIQTEVIDCFCIPDSQGIDNTVLSIQVEKGHGYLRLVNDENFVGGWIEIGQKQIQKITEDMLLVVPEGSYQVNISHKGGGGIKDVVINRNEETTLDIGDLAVAETQYGMVLFSLSPSNADLYIDGSAVDASQPITLEYGIHQIIAKADGYKSLTQYLRVGQASAGIDVVLDKVDADDEAESSESSETKEEDTTTGYYKVYVDAPEGAEVYLDGNYVGIAPCSFKKSAGSHVITLRCTGYETRSYTVSVDDEDRDISYSFADLVKTTTASANSS